MRRYNPTEIEPKWQKKWQEDKTFHVEIDKTKPKKYIIDMFPYPSGAAMHVGHVRNFTISDVLSQYHRQKGYNVMHTMGWDTFGLPAENYAIKTGTPPAETTKVNIANFKNQLNMLGMSYDWSREVNTSDPEYYRWTQWVFTKLFERGLAYQAERAQWWCETDQTVLANEQVEAGNCWRCGNPVVKKNLKQWFFKITDYADPLLEGIDDLDWPNKIKTMQRNWIGKSKGAEVKFAVDGTDEVITVFTTRPDTLFGATFMVLAPEHELVASITSDEQRAAVNDYVKAASKKSEIERQENKQKTGVATGAYAINPVNGEKIPVWIADYVLTGYGTGAIMAVPGHDERDNEFAKKFDLPITQVVMPGEDDSFNPPKPGLETVERDTVIVHLRDKSTGKFALLNWHESLEGITTAIMGGIESGQTPEEAALMEIKEEASIGNAKIIAKSQWLTSASYCASHKNQNRKAIATTLLAEVDDLSQQGEIDTKEQKLHTLVWVDENKVRDTLTPNHQKQVWDSLWDDAVYSGEGELINSGAFDGTSSAEAREAIVAHLAREDKASEKTNYKMRDWLISRQRYWGAPIPIIHCEKDGAVAVPDDQLPVRLPDVDSFAPSGKGSVLAGVEDWVNTTCPTCGGPAKRETDTMDGYACSSWYFLRYIDPKNDKQAWDPKKANYWLPVDFYCGGDHAVSHLLYTRFWFHVFADMGLIESTRKEPVGKLVYNGYILAEDGNKMSKSKGNVVNPDDLVKQGYGADSVRLFEMFIAPYEQNTNWNTNGVPGTYRFLQRFWNLVQEFESVDHDAMENPAVLRVAHQAIKSVSSDLDRLSFNTAVAALMEAVNALYKLKAENNFTGSISWQFALESITQLLAPFAPHISEEVWSSFGHTDSVHIAHWPVHDEAKLVTDTITLAIQVNGKVRAEIEVPKDASKEAIESQALSHERIQEFVGAKKPTRVIVVPGRLVNIVV